MEHRFHIGGGFAGLIVGIVIVSIYIFTAIGSFFFSVFAMIFSIFCIPVYICFLLIASPITKMKDSFAFSYQIASSILVAFIFTGMKFDHITRDGLISILFNFSYFHAAAFLGFCHAVGVQIARSDFRRANRNSGVPENT
jgi:hypothetical protein